MAGIVIIAHSPLASALRSAAAHAFPDALTRIEVLDVTPQHTPQQIESEVRALVDRAIAGSARREALVLADVFGATPCNVAQRLADGVTVKLVTGVNVPMLWRALNYAEEPLDMLVARALAGASQGILAVAAARPQTQTQNVGARPGDDHHTHQDQ